ELVGDIRDEYDLEETDRDPVPGSPTSIDAGLTIEEFSERTGVALEDGPYETAAGFVLDRLGRLAVAGDVVVVGQHEVVVTEVQNRRITRLLVRPTTARTGAEPAVAPQPEGARRRPAAGRGDAVAGDGGRRDPGTRDTVPRDTGSGPAR
ncbi:MAG: hypothetical protein H5T83_05600, partial [Actinotalea sp.]|nr:hypothetical protein [Actinotalea sp.]